MCCACIVRSTYIYGQTVANTRSYAYYLISISKHSWHTVGSDTNLSANRRGVGVDGI